jgi:hypothetical protein
MRHLSLLPSARNSTPGKPDRASARWVRGGGKPITRHLAGADVVERHGFLRRVARRVRKIRPPLRADQQLRLLQLALNVKLKREGKPVDAIRLALLEGDPTGQDVVPAQLEQSQSTLSRAPETRAR